MMTAYIAPQTFREWHPIGIYSNINKNKPFIFNIGTLPMILWFANNKNNPNVMINVCKFLGNNLKNSKVENNSLISPLYNQIYDETDNFGSIVKSNGLYWWSYKSYQKKPFSLSLSPATKTYNCHIDIDTDLLTFILNFISMNDNNDVNNRYYHSKNKKQLFIRNDKNRILYRYPYTIMVNTYRLSILPLTYTNLRIFVTTYNPITTILSYLYMNYVKYLFENEIGTSDLKNFFLFKKGMNDKNRYLETIYKSYENYMFLTDFTVSQFMINKNFY